MNRHGLKVDRAVSVSKKTLASSLRRRKRVPQGHIARIADPCWRGKYRLGAEFSALAAVISNRRKTGSLAASATIVVNTLRGPHIGVGPVSSGQSGGVDGMRVATVFDTGIGVVYA
jgi:hypothetical protein